MKACSAGTDVIILLMLGSPGASRLASSGEGGGPGMIFIGNPISWD